MRIIGLAAVAALCVASSIALAASDSGPIKGVLVKGGQNPSPPQAAQPTDTGAAPQPAENVNPTSGIGVVIKRCPGRNASRRAVVWLLRAKQAREWRQAREKQPLQAI